MEIERPFFRMSLRAKRIIAPFLGCIPKDIGKLPSDEVKAIKIRGQLHEIKHNTMRGYKTVCGKIASFGHDVYKVNRDDITCADCRRNG